ncbi:MAG TPA: TIR domain-containing protein [Acidimicrobiales bacterium]|nr:TIR domain-containing protein [Acidimicrobiales bacterium]
MKADFVQERIGEHAVTIGVRDNERMDGPFLSRCMIPIITRQNSQSQLSISSFASLLTILRRLSDSEAIQADPHPPMPERPKVFIGSSNEQLPAARALQAGIADFCEPNLWSDTFEASLTTIENLERQVSDNQFAVMVLGPDDKVESRDVQLWAPRDNVLLEFGMFVGLAGLGASSSPPKAHSSSRATSPA